MGFLAKGYKAIYPDMQLYEEIIFLQYYYKGKFIVENTKPYYEPLIKPTNILQRHIFWCNFPIESKEYSASGLRTKNKISDFDIGLDISNTKISNKRQVLRNCIDPELGLYIFESMINSI